MDRLPIFPPRTVLLGILLTGSVGTFAIIGLLPLDWRVQGKDGLESVSMVRPDVLKILGWIGLGCLCVLLAAGFYCAYRRAAVMAVIVFVTAFLCPVAGVISFVRNLAPWQIYGEVIAPDGTVYCFAESSFLQGQTLMLARVREETVFTRTIEALVVTNGDNPRSSLRIVRPAGALEQYGQVYLSDDNWLVGLRYENRCFFAYDLNARQGFGHGKVEELSPFLALGDTASPHQPDLAALLEIGAEKEKGFPTRESLIQALAHPNAQVREAAAEILKKR